MVHVRFRGEKERNFWCELARKKSTKKLDVKKKEIKLHTN